MKKLSGKWIPAVLVALLVTPMLVSSSLAGDPKALLPDGKSLWTFLKNNDYKKTFALWPETKEFAKTNGQHEPITSIYVNRTALDGINGRQNELPMGSLLVKENYDENMVLQNITVRFKARSYNPTAGNWFWAKFGPDGEIQMEGRVKPCISCHEEKKDNDFVCIAPLK